MSKGEIAATDEPAQRPRPVAVTLAGAGALLEAVVLAIGVITWLVELVAHGSSSPGVAVFLILFALGVGAVLVAGARALGAGSRRARGPLVTWQLLQGATALAVLQVPGRPGWLATLAVAMLVLSAGVVTALLTPGAAAFATR